MAEKLEITLARGTATVSHRGDEVTITLPGYMTVPQDVFFDEDKLLEHCKRHGILHAILQDGLAQELINIRAEARPADLPPLEKGGNPRPQQIDAASAQARVDKRKPTPRQPGSGADPKKAIEKLKKMGFTKEQILEMLED